MEGVHRGVTLAVAAVLGMVAGCGHAHNAPPPAAVPATKADHELAVKTGIPVASTPQGLMKEGAEAKIQERLHAKGLLKGAHRPGQFGDPTRQALRQFQKSEGLPPTGLPSYETVRHLGLDLDLIFHTTARPTEPTPPKAASGAAAPR